MRVRELAYPGCLMVAGYGSSDFIRMRLKDPRLSNTMDCHDFRGWSSWNLQVTFVLQAAPRLTSKILILSDFDFLQVRFPHCQIFYFFAAMDGVAAGSSQSKILGSSKKMRRLTMR